MAVGLLCRFFLHGCIIHQASSLETIDLTLGLLSAKVDAWHLDQWVKLLGFPNISDMLANLPSPGALLFKTQSAYFSNISDVPRENSRKSDGVMHQHIGYVRRQLLKNSVFRSFLWSHIT